MTQHTEWQSWGGKATPQTKSSPRTLLRRFWLQLLLVQSLSWIGVFSLFSSNLVLAQTPIPDAVVPPTIEASQPPVVVPVEKSATATPNAPAPARLERLMQKLSPKSDSLRQELAPRSMPAPQVSIPPARSVAQPQTSKFAPVPARASRMETTANNPATDYKNSYIDPTKYSIGATSSYEAPSRVVLSERSTGCKTILRQGQGVSGSLCGTALQHRVRGTWARRGQAIPVAGISPVRVGPISISSRGFRARGVPTRPVAYYNSKLPFSGQVGNAHKGLLFPLTVPAAITSIFGWRIHPITGNHRFHTGTDLGAPMGTPVLAADAGNVALADFLGGYGLTVVLDHNKFTKQTLYGHLSEIFVQPGEWVARGTVIGRVGSTGNSTGPHLHFETRELTPAGWVATDSGTDLEYALTQLVKALRTAQSTQKPRV